jgi:hypothetical protein
MAYGCFFFNMNIHTIFGLCPFVCPCMYGEVTNIVVEQGTEQRKSEGNNP